MEEYRYSFKKGTLVAGNYSKEEFQNEIDKINQAVGRYIECYFNAKIARHKLQARGFENNRIIELEAVFADDYKRLEPDWPDKKIEQYKTYYVGREFAFLFPFHKLAFVLNPYGFNQLEGVREGLEEIGYRVNEKREKTERGKRLYSDGWGDENYREFLRELRTKEHLQANGVDRRAREIVEKVHNMINANDYQLGVFIPKFWIGRKKHRYDMVANELIVSPIKKLIEIHGQWLSKSLEGLVEGLDLTKAIGLTSKVQTEEGIRHIPMIDLEDALDYECEYRLSSVLDKVNMKGIVISSGKSYHFYGDRLLKEEEWNKFMETLKEIRFVDEKWPDLQLKQGFSMLRITPSIRKFTQPCYLRDYHPKDTGTDSDFLRKTDDTKAKISFAA